MEQNTCKAASGKLKYTQKINLKQMDINGILKIIIKSTYISFLQSWKVINIVAKNTVISH